MGRIITPITITNALDESKQIYCEALVDTGTSFMVLPLRWKERLGDLSSAREVEFEMVDQRTAKGEICGPVRIQIEGFEPAFGEVAFVEMEPKNGRYEPIIGYIPLEQSQVTVDEVGHRLMFVRHMDLK